MTAVGMIRTYAEGLLWAGERASHEFPERLSLTQSGPSRVYLLATDQRLLRVTGEMALLHVLAYDLTRIRTHQGKQAAPGCHEGPSGAPRPDRNGK